MLELPWKQKGICMNAPKTADVPLFCEFIERKLAPGGCNMLVLLIRYRYQFQSYPECAAADPLSKADVETILETCQRHNIRLIPKINLLGHQSERTPDSRDGLLRGHPEFDETPELEEVDYCRSLCPNHPEVKPVVFGLMDELIDAFQADAVHIACDEVMYIGHCPRCQDTPKDKLFADWVNTLARHAKEEKGAQVYIWGDRLLDSEALGYGNGYEASLNATAGAVDLIDRDIVVCDWHYGKRGDYPSVDVFADAGLRMLVCPWKQEENARAFIDYAIAHDRGHIDGVLTTLWMDSGTLARYMLQGELKENDEFSVAVAEVIDLLFE